MFTEEEQEEFNRLMNYLDKRAVELDIKTLDLLDTIFDMVELFGFELTEEAKEKGYDWIIENN